LLRCTFGTGDWDRAAVSTVVARNEFSTVLNRAAFGKERVILARRGKAIAAIVPMDDVRLLRALEDAPTWPMPSRLSAKLWKMAPPLWPTSNTTWRRNPASCRTRRLMPLQSAAAPRARYPSARLARHAQLVMIWSFSQNSGVVPRYRARRSAVSAVIPRRPRTISFRRRHPPPAPWRAG